MCLYMNPPVMPSVFFGQAADVYARMIQCKTPFRGKDHDAWCQARRKLLQRLGTLDWKLWQKNFS
jgi:hypothetical protein